MMTPKDPYYTALLHGVMTEHGPTVYLYSYPYDIHISAAFTIALTTYAMYQTCLEQINFKNSRIFIDISIFALLPVYYPIWRTIPDSIQRF